MLIKRTIALGMALSLGLASGAMAARSGGHRGYSELGTGERAVGGVNPRLHPSLGGTKEALIISEGKCWMTDRKTGNYGWTDCPRR